MQNNFTPFFKAISRSNKPAAIIASLLFSILFFAHPALAQKAPTVTLVTPICATEGVATTLQITGTDFKGSGQQSRVKVSGTGINVRELGSAYVTVNSETSITVNVPGTAVVGNNQGNMVVEVGNKSGNSYTYSNDQKTVRILPKPVINTSPICKTDATQPIAVTMTVANTTQTGISYKWYDAAVNGTLLHTGPSYSPTLSASKNYYVAAAIASGCESARTAITAIVLPFAVADAGPTEVTICSGGSTVLGTPAVNGLNYSWTLVSPASGTSGLYKTNLAQPTVSHTTPGIYQYKVTATSPGCTSTAEDLINVNVTSSQTVKAEIDDLIDGNAYYTGGTYSGPNNSILLTGVTNLPAGATANFSGDGITQGTNNTATFSPCSALAAEENEKWVTISYKIITSNSCESTTSVQILVIRSSYVVLTDADPFPICRGVNTTYTAKVYRDAEIIHVNNPRHPLHNQWVTTIKSYMKDEYYRYWEPVVIPISRPGVPVNQLSDLVIDPALFNYQWFENGVDQKQNAVSVGHAGLSATDQFFVVATLKQGNLPCNVVFTIPEVPILPKGRTTIVPGESNHMWISSPQNYNMALITENQTICSNQGGSIKFTAEPDFGTGEFSGIEVSFYITSGGVKTFLSTDKTSPYEVSIPVSTIKNGDIISIEYVSTDIKCLISGGTGTSITMTVNQPPANLALTSSPSPVCPDQNSSFSVTASATGADLTYQWYKRSGTTSITLPNGNSRISGATSANLVIINVTATDAGLYYVIVKGICNSTGITSNDAELKINPKPTATASAVQSQTTKCAKADKTAVTFNLSGNADFGTPTWSVVPANTAVNINSTDPLNPIVSITGTGTYTIRLTTTSNQTPNCGEATSDVVLTVNALPTDPTITGTTICSGTAAILTASGAPTGGSYNWYRTETGGTAISEDLSGTGNNTYNPTLSNNTSSPTIISFYVESVNPNSLGNCISEKRTKVDVTVNPTYINALDPNDPIIEPSQTEYFVPAKFTANPTNIYNNITWTYQWTVVYATGVRLNNEDLTDKNGDAELNLTAQEINRDFLGVEVVQVAPANTPCVAKFSALGETGNTPQPVELLYLKAQKQNNNVVELEWATAIEKNSEGFEVQVSQDAKNYRTLAFVASKAGGNTSQKQVYTFHDKENGKYGTRYYRLMQRDMNGDSEYFGPKAVQIGETAKSLVAYPNPFNQEINLDINAAEAGSMHVIVTNAIGAKVLERTLRIEKGSNRQKLLVNGELPQGVYHLTTRLNGQVQHLKLLKQK